MTNINPVKPNMDYVKKLLKGRKAGAELELSFADANNLEHSESIDKRKDEISQIDKALLVLYPVIKCEHKHIIGGDGCFECVDCGVRGF
tara:strand:+ start:144 stop:410 length:267 start_codon:yes stop_codon:yes gene_type:complete